MLVVAYRHRFHSSSCISAELMVAVEPNSFLANDAHSNLLINYEWENYFVNGKVVAAVVYDQTLAAPNLVSLLLAGNYYCDSIAMTSPLNRMGKDLSRTTAAKDSTVLGFYG